MFPNMLPLASGQFGVLPVMPIQAMTHKATRHARRVYVGGLPANANEQVEERRRLDILSQGKRTKHVKNKYKRLGRMN
nr:splicing factor U2af large subunit B-like isoform X2 [Nicotiana tomentosiformis]